jgi:HK97 family phage portal protein
MISKILNYFGGKKSRHSNSINQIDFANIDSFFSDSGIKQSYKNNVIVHRCVDLISQAASHVHLVTYVNGKKSSNNKIIKILQRPNHLTSGATFFEKIVAHKLLFGNSYILATTTNNKCSNISELFILQPNSVEVVVENSMITGYKYNISSSKAQFFSLDQTNGRSQILHLKNYNPYSEIYGISNLDSATSSIELHNQTMKWNNALLKNGARPTGALVMRGENSYLSDEQFSRLKEQLAEKYSGSPNSGRPLLLEGGLDWKEMSISPKDMDFIESKSSAAREIALAFGVPPQLLGISGDNTYSNMQEARLALWEETIIPILDNLTDGLSQWFSSMLGEEIKIDFDRDSISALAEKRENVWAKISSANFMTINEKRALIGLPPIEGGSSFQEES